MSSPRGASVGAGVGELLEREWVAGTAKEKCSNTFKVLQWNVLADAMAHGNFIKCPTNALNWAYRSQLILKEISRSEADIVCLEEVDHFSDFFEPHLKSLGFDGIFAPKHDSPCLQYQPNNGPDGCAVFYRLSKFSCLQKEEFRLTGKQQELSNQVALFVRLEVKDVHAEEDLPCKICVGVTHLKAKRDYSALRATQGENLLVKMASFAKNDSVIVCGDFNATPDEPVYQSFSSNHLLVLTSAYAASNKEEPKLTSWKFRENGESRYTIDYIWISQQNMRVTSIWSLPTEEEIGLNALPSLSYPSDHLALGCCITLT